MQNREVDKEICGERFLMMSVAEAEQLFPWWYFLCASYQAHLRVSYLFIYKSVQFNLIFQFKSISNLHV